MKPVYARVTLLSAFLLLLLLAACSKEPVTPEPTLPMGLKAGWNEIKPGGETLCADGSAYRFFVSPGNENKLLVDFEGGGACWNGGLCSAPSTPGNNFQGLYLDRVYGSPKDYGFNGIYDRSNPKNPFKNWYHVHISYCTGDLHLGNNTALYPLGEGATKTVEHKGAVNVEAALAWISEKFGGPKTIFVAGVSAGAYPAIVYLPEFAEVYPEAALYQLGDSGAGVVTEDFFAGDAANWQIAGALPELSEPVALDATFLTNLYTVMGDDYPDAQLSQYTSILDGTQIGFYALMQGITQPTPALAQDWTTKMQTSLAIIAAETPNFRFYLSALDLDSNATNGTAHVILQRPELYTLATSDVRFQDWLSDLTKGRNPASVSPPTPQ